jgi:cohesin loading factor subunit SCC2
LTSILDVLSGREYGNKENLKEMGDVSSGMASTVVQVYLRYILESFIHPDLVTVL